MEGVTVTGAVIVGVPVRVLVSEDVWVTEGVFVGELEILAVIVNEPVAVPVSLAVPLGVCVEVTVPVDVCVAVPEEV